MTSQDFLSIYWKYYINLEKDFLNTERYVAIEKDNEKTYSVEYIKILQLTCAEIDVLAKVFCCELEKGFKGEKMPHYCKKIKNIYPKFVEEQITFIDNNEKIIPWKGWEYTESKSKDGKIRINGSGPKWWSEHNKVKHSRTLKNNDILNYKKANQKNVIYSLAALYQLEIYCYRFLTKGMNNVLSMPIPKSDIFKIDRFENDLINGSEIFLIEE